MNIICLLLGLLFGIGLAYSGMTDPNKVLGFLDLFGRWDPTLVFVMASGVTTTFIAYKIILKREKPVFSALFSLPTHTAIDSKLIGGALMFGVGWGLYGYCPGPAIASLSYLNYESFLFVAAMGAGIWIRSRQVKT